MKKANVFLLLAIFAIGFSSCVKETEDLVAPQENVTFEEMNVSSDFNYETFKNIELNLTGFTNGLAEVSSMDGDVYQKAYLKKWQEQQFVVTVPTYATSLTLKFEGVTASVDLHSDVINWVFQK